MSRRETPMIRRYWETVGGTLIPEFQVVPRSSATGRRLVDAVILTAGPRKQMHWTEVGIEGHDIIAVQAKAHRLGMYLMGQAVFSAELLRERFRPASVRSVILCTFDDAVLKPLLKKYPGVEVVVMSETPTSSEGTAR